MKTTICSLLYGDFPHLASRLLSSLTHRALVKVPVRIGLNEVSPQTLQIVQEFFTSQTDNGRRVDLLHSPVNRFKYPVMRDLVHGTAKLEPITSDYTMWFDDDSWLFPDAPANWLDEVHDRMMHSDVIGSIWVKDLESEQPGFYKSQPWYNNRPIDRRVHFITGGWWTIKTKILTTHNWPPLDMLHNGGDVAMGLLCSQHNYSICQFTKHLGINANDTGKCSTAKRRGVSQPAYGTHRWEDLKAYAQLPDDRHPSV